jgi:hypothetical protein
VRGPVAYAVFSALWIFAVRGLGQRMRKEHEAAVADARARLGRETSEEESTGSTRDGCCGAVSAGS